MASYLLAELAAIIVPYISRRRSNHFRYTYAFSIYSDISTRITESSLPNNASASALDSSVFPTPVGPRNKKEPIGRPGSFSPTRPLRTACRHCCNSLLLPYSRAYAASCSKFLQTLALSDSVPASAPESSSTQRRPPQYHFPLLPPACKPSMLFWNLATFFHFPPVSSPHPAVASLESRAASFKFRLL